jgi:hypothetical protein
MTSYLFNFFHEDMKIADINSNNKAARIGSVKLRESSSRIEKYSRLDCKPITLGRTKNQRFWDFDVEAIKEYIEQELGGGKNEEDEHNGEGRYVTRHVGQGVFEGAFVGGHEIRK